MGYFNDLYLHIDEGTLWTNDVFKEHYIHYQGADKEWSKPFEKWKLWFASNTWFIKLEDFLNMNWDEIKMYISRQHYDFFELFKNGQSKSEIFLTYLFMFDDLDSYFAEYYNFDIENIREFSPIQDMDDTGILKKIKMHS